MVAYVQFTYDNSLDKTSIWLDGILHEYEVDNIDGTISTV